MLMTEARAILAALTGDHSPVEQAIRTIIRDEITISVRGQTGYDKWMADPTRAKAR